MDKQLKSEKASLFPPPYCKLKTIVIQCPDFNFHEGHRLKVSSLLAVQRFKTLPYLQ